MQAVVAQGHVCEGACDRTRGRYQAALLVQGPVQLSPWFTVCFNLFFTGQGMFYHNPHTTYHDILGHQHITAKNTLWGLIADGTEKTIG